MDELGVRDLVKPVGGAVRPARGFERVERDAHGAIAGGVDLHGEPLPVELGHVVGQLLRLVDQLAPEVFRVRRVREIRLEHRRRARGGDAVEEDLREVGVDVRGLLPRALGDRRELLLARLAPRVLPGEARRDAHRELARPVEIGVGTQRVAVDERVLERRHADLVQLRKRPLQRFLVLLRRVRRQLVHRLERRLVLQDAGRLPVAVARDHAALGVGRRLVDPDAGERGRVEPGAVDGLVAQEDRVVLRDRVEQAPVRRVLRAEQALRPEPAADPLALRRARGALPDLVEDLRHRQREREAALEEAGLPGDHRVGVQVLDARHQHAPAEVDDASLLPAQRQHVRALADRGDPAPANRQGLGPRRSVVDRVDPGVRVDELGRRLRLAAASGPLAAHGRHERERDSGREPGAKSLACHRSQTNSWIFMSLRSLCVFVGADHGFEYMAGSSIVTS